MHTISINQTASIPSASIKINRPSVKTYEGHKTFRIWDEYRLIKESKDNGTIVIDQITAALQSKKWIVKYEG